MVLKLIWNLNHRRSSKSVKTAIWIFSLFDSYIDARKWSDKFWGFKIILVPSKFNKLKYIACEISDFSDNYNIMKNDVKALQKMAPEPTTIS